MRLPYGRRWGRGGREPRSPGLLAAATWLDGTVARLTLSVLIVSS